MKSNAAVKAPKAPVIVNGQRKKSIWKRFWETKFLFALFVPALIYYLVFCYYPMWGVSLAFFDYNPFMGLKGSDFVGFENFEVFFKSPNFIKYVWNTLVLGLQSLLISFPATILFALMMNEIRNLKFKKAVQTISYMPHFMSTVVIVSLITTLCDPTNGAINLIIHAFGGESIYFMMKPEWFRPLYLISGMWQGLGWGTIIYLAAISNVDPGLYEAAKLDGAGRWRQMWNITLPSIAPTVTTMLIMQCGKILGASMEKILLMQQPATYEVSMDLTTYVYHVGIVAADYSKSIAIGLFTNIVNLILLVTANFISKKLTDEGIF